MKTQIILITIAFLVCLVACKKDNDTEDNTPTPTPVNMDSLLFAKSKETGFVWYQQNDSIKRSSSASPHSKYFRVRFNSIAQSALTDNGRLPQGGVFPQGSFVVKELYDSATAPLKLLAMMYKDSANSLAVNGWVWLELKGDGGNYISATEKGVQCIGCHALNSRDQIRVFDLF
ncbi:MAG: cytochrome P460 family protein [Bacteroidota bacterium]